MEDCPFPDKKKYTFFSAAFMDAAFMNQHLAPDNPYSGAYECCDHFHVGRLWRPEDRATQKQINRRVIWLQNEIGRGMDLEQVAQLLVELNRQGGRSARHIMDFWQSVPPQRYRRNRRHGQNRKPWQKNLPI